MVSLTNNKLYSQRFFRAQKCGKIRQSTFYVETDNSVVQSVKIDLPNFEQVHLLGKVIISILSDKICLCCLLTEVLLSNNVIKSR